MFVFPQRVGATPSILIELYDAATDLPVNLTGFTSLSASAAQVDGEGTVDFPVVVIDSATDGRVKLSGYAANAFTPGVWDVTIRAHNPAGEPVAYPQEAGLLQIEVTE